LYDAANGHFQSFGHNAVSSAHNLSRRSLHYRRLLLSLLLLLLL
jgi:hypothetical protein